MNGGRLRTVGLLTLAGVVTLAPACSATKAPPIDRPNVAPREVEASPTRPPVRWLRVDDRSSEPPQEIARLNSPAGQLTVMDDGRRIFVDAEGHASGSGYALPYNVASVLSRGPQLAFVTRFGGVYVTDEPLGPPTIVRNGPGLVGAVRTAAGKEAIVSVTNEGWVVRTTDLGRTWKLASTKVTGLPQSIALDRNGRGLLSTTPQTLWRTDDDGSTWRRIETPGNGAAGVTLGQGGELMLACGDRWSRQWFVLAEQGFSEAPERPVSRVAWPGIAAQHLGSEGVLQISSPRDAEAPVPFAMVGFDPVESTQSGTLPISDCRAVQAFGHDDTQWVGCMRDYRTMALWQRRGNGAWKPDGEIPGDERQPPFAGPDGWLLSVGHVRPGYGQPVIALSDEPVTWRHAIVSHGAVHLVGERGGGWVYAVSSPTEPKPRIQPLSSAILRGTALVERDRGVVVMADIDGKWVILDPAKSSDRPPTPEPMDSVPAKTRRLLFSGERGIALDDACGLFETADGGRGWTKIEGEIVPHTTCHAARITDGCTERGCRIGDDIRVGWQLDPTRKAPAKAIDPDSVPPELTRTGDSPKVQFRCELTGGMTVLGLVKDTLSLLDSFDVGRGVHWATPVLDDKGAGVMVAREDSPPTRHDVFDPIRGEGSRWSHHGRILPEGFVIVRESARGLSETAPGGVPVLVELAAHRWANGNTWKGEVRIRREGPINIGPPHLSLVAAGAVYRPLGVGDPLAHLVPESGRSSRLEVPDPIPEGGLLIDGPSGLTALHSHDEWLSARMGARKRDWFIGGHVHHGSWGGRPAVGIDVFGGAGDWAESTPFVVTIADAPDPEIVYAPAASEVRQAWDKPCEPGASGGVTSWVRQALDADLSSVDESLAHSSGHVIVRMRAGQPMCAVGFVTATFMPMFAFIPASAPDSAYLFRKYDREPSGWLPLSTHRLRCSRVNGA